MTPRQRGLIEKITQSRNFELWDEGIEAVSALLAQRDRYEKALQVIAADKDYAWVHARPSPRKIAREALRCE